MAEAGVLGVVVVVGNPASRATNTRILWVGDVCFLHLWNGPPEQESRRGICEDVRYLIAELIRRLKCSRSNELTRLETLPTVHPNLSIERQIPTRTANREIKANSSVHHAAWTKAPTAPSHSASELSLQSSESVTPHGAAQHASHTYSNTSTPGANPVYEPVC